MKQEALTAVTSMLKTKTRCQLGPWTPSNPRPQCLSCSSVDWRGGTLGQRWKKDEASSVCHCACHCSCELGGSAIWTFLLGVSVIILVVLAAGFLRFEKGLGWGHSSSPSSPQKGTKGVFGTTGKLSLVD
ncbi:unnamed protein product [Durusdinium trenchii]|uniref:Uncharacterized protein n=1 Tax=Durusdinium trenchii TaxID=1381693 RepID=A0ABP0PWS2_9DINO